MSDLKSAILNPHSNLRINNVEGLLDIMATGWFKQILFYKDRKMIKWKKDPRVFKGRVKKILKKDVEGLDREQIRNELHKKILEK